MIISNIGIESHVAELDAGADHHLLLQLIHGERLAAWTSASGCSPALPTWCAIPAGASTSAIMNWLSTPAAPSAGNSVELFEDAVDWVFGDDAGGVTDAIDDFFSAMPLGVRTARGLLCTHSLPDAARMNGFDLDVLDREPVPDDYQGLTGSAWMLTWGRRHDPEILIRWRSDGTSNFASVANRFPKASVRTARLVAINSISAAGGHPLISHDPLPESLRPRRSCCRRCRA